MATLRDYKQCSTHGIRLLDIQLISQMLRISPGCLVSFSGFERLQLGGGVHPWLQPAAANALKEAIAARPGVYLQINSAYRTLAQQLLLWWQFQQRVCKIPAAAKPGQSNHNSGLALDVEDYRGWRPFMESVKWDWIGSFDPPHYDFEGAGGKDLRAISTKAYQYLYNYNFPTTPITVDGIWGRATEQALFLAPQTGFAKTPASRSEIEDLAEVYHSRARSMRVGMSGDDIQKLQSMLKITANGVFGQATVDAVKNFQQAEGLVPDGVVGMATKIALRIA